MNNILKIMTLISAIISIHTESTTNIYNSYEEKSEKQAVAHSKTHQSLCRYLANRDVPRFISQYVQGKKTLDYGMGTGFSTQLLQELGLEVVGVDISKEMLMQAKNNCPNIPFYLMQDNSIPVESDTYDLVFSSLVLFELSTQKEILKYLQEAKRVMKDDGVFIAITGSQDLYTKNWLFYDVDYPENKELSSGSFAKIYIRDIDMKFTNFYWTEIDYCNLFQEAGFKMMEIYYPLGYESEPFQWKDEKMYSPFVIFVAKKR